MKLWLHKINSYLGMGANGGIIAIMAMTAVLTLFGSVYTVNTKLAEYEEYHKHEMDEVHEYVRNIEWYLFTTPHKQ